MTHASTRLSLEAAVQDYFRIPPDEAALVVAELDPVVCRGGDWLFRQGDAADCMYLLARGRLQVWVDQPDGEETRPSLVGEVGPGEMVGEVGMLTGGERSAGLRAVRNSLLLRVSADTFDGLVQRHPALMRRVAGGVAERLRERTAGRAPVNRRFSAISLFPVDRGPSALQLAETLSEALARHGTSLVLTAARLRDLGAPSLPVAPGGEASPAFIDWLAERETEHRFVLLVADPDEHAWSDIALRHADLALLVADARSEPAVRPWERSFLGDASRQVARRALVLQHPGQPETLAGTAAWLDGRDLDFHLHLRSGVRGDLERLARILSGTAVGLVLGGGAARGFAHLGVYRAMAEAGTPVDWLGGSSIGAIIAAGIARYGEPIGIIDRARKAFVEGKPFGDLTLPVVSLLSGRRMERLIGEFLEGQIEDLPVPLFCVSSNLSRGSVQRHERGSLPLALRASASLPGVFPPVVIDRRLAIDGGILDNLPVDIMREKPVGRVVAVDVTSRRDHQVDYPAVPSPWRVLAGRTLPMVRRFRVPGTISMLLMALAIGTMEASREAGERADLVISPDLSKFGFTDVRPYDQIVSAGYEAGRNAIAGSWLAGPRDQGQESAG